jgi:hypothetical protein
MPTLYQPAVNHGNDSHRKTQSKRARPQHTLEYMLEYSLQAEESEKTTFSLEEIRILIAREANSSLSSNVARWSTAIRLRNLKKRHFP